MSDPRTLLQIAGANPAPARLSEAALVVIDAQGEYREGALPLEGITAAAARLAALIERARGAGALVIHVAHRGRPGSLFDRAGPGGAFLPEAAPRDGEAIVEKTMPNAFAGTDLNERLAAAGNPPVILAGFMTHMCVSSTARAGLDLGHRITVAADATATRTLPGVLGEGPVSASAIQTAALAALADRFAAVVPVDRIPD